MIRSKKVISALTLGAGAAGLCVRAQCLHTEKKSLQSIRIANSSKNLIGGNALVVGGTSGIGEGVARRLAQAKISVTIAGRNEKRGQEIVEDLYRLSGDKDDRIKHKFIACDTSTMKSIESFCANMENDLKKENKTLDILVLSQGIATIQGRMETSEGIDEKLQLHYFGRMYFIDRLLPLLRQSTTGGKVLSVLSAGVHKPYSDFKTDFELKDNYSLSNAANSAGMYNDLCLAAYAVQKENQSVAFIHSAPGVVSTNWGKELPLPLRGAVRLLQKVVAKSIDDCGEIMADALIGDEALPGQAYLVDENGNPAKKMDIADYDGARDFVWDATQTIFRRIIVGKH